MSAVPVTLTPGFVRDADALFRHLSNSVVWDERMRARKTASFGVAYNYSQMAYPPVAMPADLGALCIAIGGAVGLRPNNCLLNAYADGDSSMGFHSDTSDGLTPGSGVAIISLGATRPIVFRAKANKAVEHTFELVSGSLLFMPASVQDDWLHAIPKFPTSGARISATFRSVTNR